MVPGEKSARYFLVLWVLSRNGALSRDRELGQCQKRRFDGVLLTARLTALDLFLAHSNLTKSRILILCDSVTCAMFIEVSA